MNILGTKIILYIDALVEEKNFSLFVYLFN